METLCLSPNYPVRRTSKRSRSSNLNVPSPDCEDNDGIENRMSLRKKVRPLANNSVKTPKAPKNPDNVIIKYYTSKKVKRTPSTLETIFEEPKEHQGNLLLMGQKKVKRTLDFKPNTNKAKCHKRQMKAKSRLSSSSAIISCIKRLRISKTVSLEMLKEKLQAVEDI